VLPAYSKPNTCVMAAACLRPRSLLEGLPGEDIPNRCKDVLDFLAVDRQASALPVLCLFCEPRFFFRCRDARAASSANQAGPCARRSSRRGRG
jgi:hypothetical protein